MLKSRKNPPASWELAARLCQYSLSDSGKAESMLDQYVYLLSSRERAYCQRLFYASIRHRRLIEATLGKLILRSPRPGLAGLLRAALSDALDSLPDSRPKVADFWVGKARNKFSKGESGLVNAVLRRAFEWWVSDDVRNNPALLYSHPDWLINRWIEQFGLEKAVAIMAGNQKASRVFLRVRDEGQALPRGCEATQWPGFVMWSGEGDWSDIQQELDLGRMYAQDPGTRLAPALLNVQPGEQVLDLCAAPGGKSLLIADALSDDSSGLLVCVDLPGPRIPQLDENLRKLDSDEGPGLQLLEADVRELNSSELGLFDAILLDAPCSNTGVIRRRPDVKWRLTEASVQEMAALQVDLLTKAAELLRPGGRMVYSTCSIEREENSAVVDRFLAKEPTFKLIEGQIYDPVETGHDGAGAYLLKNHLR